MNFDVIIGLEVHAQLLTRSKLFCGCSTDFGAEANQNTCPVCLGLPGVLPVLNRRAVDFAIRLTLAVGGEVTQRNIFARKNYFYPDLPKGYQVSQYETPLCRGGKLQIETDQGKRVIRLNRAHLEEDAGKLLHEHPFTRSKTASWVDLNRSGVPLLEIVSEPDLRSPREAIIYLKELRRLLIYLDICDGNMEEGSFRCDANISLRPSGQARLGTKVELKNMNSFRHIEKALEYETERQAASLQKGDLIRQETRLWDPEAEATQPMRSKEEAHDYRYFPDPDLLPVEIDDSWIERIRQKLPELPSVRKVRFSQTMNLPSSDLEVLLDSKDLADFFESCVALYAQPKKVANWIINDLLGLVKGDFKIIPSKIAPAAVAQTFELVDQGTLSAPLAKAVLKKVFETGRSPDEIIREEGWVQISDVASLEKVIDEVLNENPKEIARWKGGEEKLFSFFLGQVMKKTSGKANPREASDLVRKKLPS